MQLASQIYSCGYLLKIETIIQKAVNLLMLDASSNASKELSKLVIEQSFYNLQDLVHFLEADGPELRELTSSNLVLKSFMLISQHQFQTALASVKIMTRVSYFFAELSEDNQHIGCLLTPELQAFVH